MVSFPLFIRLLGNLMDYTLITQYYPSLRSDTAIALGFALGLGIAIALLAPFLQRNR